MPRGCQSNASSFAAAAANVLRPKANALEKVECVHHSPGREVLPLEVRLDGRQWPHHLCTDGRPGARNQLCQEVLPATPQSAVTIEQDSCALLFSGALRIVVQAVDKRQCNLPRQWRAISAERPNSRALEALPRGGARHAGAMYPL